MSNTLLSSNAVTLLANITWDRPRWTNICDKNDPNWDKIFSKAYHELEMFGYINSIGAPTSIAKHRNLKS